MASRVARWDLLAHEADPITGRPDDIEALARYYRDMATDIEQAASQLRPVGEGDLSTGEGESVDKIRSRSRAVTESLTQMHGRYQQAGEALQRFRDALGSETDRGGEGTVMATSWSAVQKAMDASSELGNVHATADPAKAAQDAGREPTPQEHDDTQRRAQRIDELDGTMSDARTMLAKAQSDLAAAGKAAASTMKGAWKDGLHDSGWYKFLHVLIKIFTVIGMILGVLAFFIPGLGIAAIVGVIGATFAVVASALKFATGEGSILEVVLGLVGMVTLGMGSRISAVTKGAISKGISSARGSIASAATRTLNDAEHVAARQQIFAKVLDGRSSVADAMRALGKSSDITRTALKSELKHFDSRFEKTGPSWWNALSFNSKVPWFSATRETARGDWGVIKDQWSSVRHALGGGGEAKDSAWLGRFLDTADLIKRKELDAWLGARGLAGIGGPSAWHYGGTVFGSVWGRGTFVGVNIGLGNDFGTPTPNPGWVAEHKGAFPNVHA